MEMQERNDYPRPDFKREVWQNLNGIWEFAFDDSNEEKPLDIRQVPKSYL